MIMIYIVLLFLIVQVNCLTSCFRPLHRYFHTTTHINSGLYSLSELTEDNIVNEIVRNESFCLDASTPFYVSKVSSLKNLAGIDNIVQAYIDNASVKSGANKVILYEGKNVNVTSAVIVSQSNSDEGLHLIVGILLVGMVINDYNENG